MFNYEIRIFPKLAEDNSTYWTAYYPSVPGCIGSGDTVEEAIGDAQENLKFYIEYLKDEHIKIPDEDYKTDYSGRIALRVSKSLHQKIAEVSEDEGISINLFINNAIENYIGKKAYDMSINKKIDDLIALADAGLIYQHYHMAMNQEAWNNFPLKIKNYIEEVQYE